MRQTEGVMEGGTKGGMELSEYLIPHSRPFADT